VMALPPFAGATQVTTACILPGVALTDVGAAGAVAACGNGPTAAAGVAGTTNVPRTSAETALRTTVRHNCAPRCR